MKFEIPGPGSYQIPGTLAKTSYSMTGRKTDANKDNFPGPGSYNTTDRPKSPSWTLGKTPRLDFAKLSVGVPGPGSYSPRSSFKAKGAVFGTSLGQELSLQKFRGGTVFF